MRDSGKDPKPFMSNAVKEVCQQEGSQHLGRTQHPKVREGDRSEGTVGSGDDLEPVSSGDAQGKPLGDCPWSSEVGRRGWSHWAV